MVPIKRGIGKRILDSSYDSLMNSITVILVKLFYWKQFQKQKRLFNCSYYTVSVSESYLTSLIHSFPVRPWLILFPCPPSFSSSTRTPSGIPASPVVIYVEPGEPLNLILNSKHQGYSSCKLKTIHIHPYPEHRIKNISKWVNNKLGFKEKLKIKDLTISQM